MAETLGDSATSVPSSASGQLLDRPGTSRSEPAPRTPQQIGAFRILETIGEGGMGVVYKAEQREPVRRIVALKVIKLGMDTKEVVARFEAERQALAMLSHPNVARVFEAGMTEAGRPYFAMEHVAGIPLNQYCADNNLTTRDRLELFIPVCRAVQHAHQKGIIHRDLKPTNLLVALMDGKPVPKVIDFGIAKATNQALTHHTLFTSTGSLIGTPEYMSPEQAMTSGLDVDTRTDIYSLGVILYELLTGSLPLDPKSLREAGLEGMARMIKTTEPQRPSTRLATLSGSGKTDLLRGQTRNFRALQRELRGDLDWIVLKCMEKDRSRRYDTANGLAMDLVRHLAHEPIVARPPGTAYRMWKFIRRHRVGVSAGVAVTAALLVGLFLAISGFIRAKTDRDVADKARVEAQQQKAEADTQRQWADANARSALQEKENARWSLARANIALAEAAYREHDGNAMKVTLDQVPPDLRDDSWSYLLAHADTSLATVEGFHCGSAPHPTRAGVFAAATIEKIRLIDASSGMSLFEFAVSPMQARNSYRRGVAISPDGRRLAAGSLGRGGIAIYDLQTGKHLIEWEAPETDTLEFSADGKRLLQTSSIDSEVCLWDAETGQKAWSVKSALRAAFVPPGQRVVVLGNFDGQLGLAELDAADGSVRRELPRPRPSVMGFAVRPDGKALAIGDFDGYVRCTELAEGRVIFENRLQNHLIRFLAFTADSRRLISVSDDAGRQSIRIWDAKTGIYLQSLLGGSGKPESLQIHPVSNDVLVTGPLTKTWNISSPAPIATLFPYASAAFVGTDDQTLCGGYWEKTAILDLANSPSAPTWQLNDVAFELIEISANGGVVAIGKSGNEQSRIRLFNVENGQLHPTHQLDHFAAISFLRLSPDGSRLLSFIPEGRTCYCYDTLSGKALHIQIPSNVASLRFLDVDNIWSINDLVWLGNSRVVGLTTFHDRPGTPQSEEAIVLWDVAGRNQIVVKKLRIVPRRLAAAPDGRTFAEGGTDRMIRIRDGSTLDVAREFRAHDDSISAIAWHPSRPLLATASADLTIKLWDLRTNRCIEEIRGVLRPATTLKFSPTGRRLLAVAGQAVRVWEPSALRSEIGTK